VAHDPTVARLQEVTLPRDTFARAVLPRALELDREAGGELLDFPAQQTSGLGPPGDELGDDGLGPVSLTRRP
jgi:hypothetical protein